MRQENDLWPPEEERCCNQREFVPLRVSVLQRLRAEQRDRSGACTPSQGERQTEWVREIEERRGLHVPRRSGERFVLSLLLHIVRRLQPPRAGNAGNFRLELVVFHLFCWIMFHTSVSTRGLSVWRVHVAVAALLLLFLLHQELLQSRRTGLHHRARPDWLQKEG